MGWFKRSVRPEPVESPSSGRLNQFADTKTYDELEAAYTKAYVLNKDNHERTEPFAGPRVRLCRIERDYVSRARQEFAIEVYIIPKTLSYQ